jgi:Rap1a immunity proteins
MALEELDRQKVHEALSNYVNLVTQEKPLNPYSRSFGLPLHRLRLMRSLRLSWNSRDLRPSRIPHINAATILTLILLVVPLTVTAADNLPPGGIGNESGEQLLARCEPALRVIEAGSDAGMNDTERIEAASCIGLVDGFIWGHAWSSWRKRSDMFFCAPEPFSATEGVPALVNYLRARPNRLIQHAHLLIFAAFSNAYPCNP